MPKNVGKPKHKPKRRPGGFRKKAPRQTETFVVRTSWPLARDLDRFADQLSEDLGVRVSMNQAITVALVEGLRQLDTCQREARA